MWCQSCLEVEIAEGELCAACAEKNHCATCDDKGEYTSFSGELELKLYCRCDAGSDLRVKRVKERLENEGD